MKLNWLEIPQSGQPNSASLSYKNYTDSDELRFLLKLANLSQRSAAKYLNVDERTLRSWCAGDGEPPALVLRVLAFLASYPAGLMRLIESNAHQTITGTNYLRSCSRVRGCVAALTRLGRACERVNDPLVPEGHSARGSGATSICKYFLINIEQTAY